MKIVRAPLIALSLVTLAGCPTDSGVEDGENESDGETETSGEGDGDGDSTTAGDGDGDATTGDGDGDATTGSGTCGDGIVDDNEECDDGNLSDFDACTNNCLFNICGDGLEHEGVEECDDGNNNSDDGCSDECAAEFCGDGVIQASEECDDSNMFDNDECTASCTVAVCGDGSILDGVEVCDDGNDDDSDSCPSSCEPAFCGDGFVYAGEEECDDANDEYWDGCAPGCEYQPAVKSWLMVCGEVERDVTSFFPPELELQVVESCAPGVETQALMISGNAGTEPLAFNVELVRDWVAAGGILISERGSSDEVFNAVFEANVGEGESNGGCQARFPMLHQYSPDDLFWLDNEFFGAMPDWQSGCGNDISGLPDITPLAGWTPDTVSVAYRDHGAGRVWLADFDWATDFGEFNMATTYSLMGYMITRGQSN